jgi:hypothetical protein
MGFLSPKSAGETFPPNQPTDIEQFSDPTTTHIETSGQEQKWHLSSKAKDGDTALTLFSNPDDLHEVISPADERALQWKIDLMILPYLAVCYAFFYIDKTTLSYAAIFGIKDDLKLVGTQYSWLSSIFYFGFLAWACMFTFPNRDEGLMSNSSDEFHDAKIPDWKVPGVQYLYVGSISYAAKLCEEFYRACCVKSILRCRRGMLRSLFHVDYVYVVSGRLRRLCMV